MTRRRVFSPNIEVTMGDHIKTVAQTAKQGKYIRPRVSEVGIPITLLEGVTSFLDLPASSKTECQLKNSTALYPYGQFYRIVNYNKFELI
jgi:hypothetical protein